MVYIYCGIPARFISMISVLSIMLALAVSFVPTQSAYALDQYPKWGRDGNNVIYNGYYTNTTFNKLWDIYTSNNDFWSKVVVVNDTGSTWTVRTKAIPATANQITLRNPSYYIVYPSAGSSGSCYDAATGGEAWGCQFTILDGGSVEAWALHTYTGDNTPSWYSTVYYLYPNDYSYTIATHTVWVTLH